MRTVLLLLLLAIPFSPLLHAEAGRTGLSFLKLGIGARSLGMGEAYSAVGQDPASTFYNPAGLARASSPELLLMHREWIQDVKTEYLGATTLWNGLALGVSLNATSVGNIEIRSTPGPAIGTFAARNAAIGLSAAYAIDQSLGIGVTGKYIYEKFLVDEASGLAFDIGATYYTPWDLRLALAFNNFGSMNELRNEASTLPKYFRAGAAFETPLKDIEGMLTLSTDLVSFSEESESHLHLGAEVEFKKSFALRLGYQTAYEGKNISAGVGFHHGLFSIDYAFVPFKYDLGTTHTFSLGIHFQ